MAMQKHMSFLILVYALLGILSSLKFGYGNKSCIEIEKQALLHFKESLVDKSKYLSSWVGDDCCAWDGIVCNNITGHVIQLDLRDGNLRGDHINPSLLDLEYLTYLDLSYNSFDEMQIPQFFGSFKDLTYLNLSYNSFKGLVPHHLGNLSSLGYLDLSHNTNINYDDYSLLSIDSMIWLSGLSLLKHLDLSYVDLSRATDWVPSNSFLLVLKLGGCELPNNYLTFMNLTSLVSLDLNFNHLNSSFPLWVLNNSGLAHLNLGGNQCNGPIPNSIGSLTSLLKLDLSFNNFRGSIPESVGNLTSLVSLDLRYNRFNTSFPLWVLNNSGLAHLNLGDNQFNGLIPNSIGTLTSLSLLELGFNEFQGSLPESIGRLTSLTILDLGFNKFEGLIPRTIGDLTSLTFLRLSKNNFHGLIPESIWALTSLTELHLGFNNFHGLIPQSIGNLTSLSSLDLSSNKLSGSIPEIGNLTELIILEIGANEFKGCLPESFCQLSKLESLNVYDNQLSGSIPECIGELSELEELSLDSNSWEGFVSEHHFVNLTSLFYFSISSKSNLVWNVSSNWVPPSHLQQISMQSLKVGPKFPRWLLTHRHIKSIRMRNTSISDTIPADWLVSLLSQAYHVDLSNNNINVEHLSLISAAPNGLLTLALSHNRLSGEFPSFFCNLTSLRNLVLSNNNFSGELPRCLGNLTELEDLDVMNNSFSGDIPVSLGSLVNLNYLNLNNNKFQGKLPLSFQNLNMLVALDVGKNNLSDILPPWSGGQLPGLKYLILRSNNFFGEIPPQLCHYSSIQVLNLAGNQIRGNIPPCFVNFSAMIKSDNNELDLGFSSENGEMIIDEAKGYELEYTSTLGYLFSIDLSNNSISGEIPEELMDLRELVNLNLAGNYLTGRIPDRIGKLKKLEFLDLSRNELNGSIPQSLSDLNSISHLNLSFNDLSGKIPTGYQLQTLDDPSIYAGNNQLCGWPILKPCARDTKSHNVHDYNEANSDDECMWFYAGIGPGLLVGFLGFCASLHFIKPWRYSYFQFIEQVFDKIAVAIALLRRKFQN